MRKKCDAIIRTSARHFLADGVSIFVYNFSRSLPCRCRPPVRSSKKYFQAIFDENFPRIKLRNKVGHGLDQYSLLRRAVVMYFLRKNSRHSILVYSHILFQIVFEVGIDIFYSFNAPVYVIVIIIAIRYQPSVSQSNLILFFTLS